MLNLNPFRTGGVIYTFAKAVWVGHSQMVRPFRSEVRTLWRYLKAGEFVYDHPFLFGNKRKSKLLRVGANISDNLALTHMYDPQSTSSVHYAIVFPWWFVMNMMLIFKLKWTMDILGVTLFRWRNWKGLMRRWCTSYPNRKNFMLIL